MATSPLIDLSGKKGLIIGVANSHSIATGCAHAMHRQGATLALTYLNDKARPYVEPIAKEIDAALLLPCDVTDDAQMDAVFAEIEKQWGRLDFVLHSIAFAPMKDLHGRVTDCSKEAFATAMDISCHSFIRMAKRAEPLMKEGGSLMTVSYYGSEKVVKHYNMMGPVKAALEATARYLAAELGSKGIRVNTLSPGPLRTRAASGLEHFEELVSQAEEKSPLRRLVTNDEVGNVAAFLASDAASAITGDIFYIDAGYGIID